MKGISIVHGSDVHESAWTCGTTNVMAADTVRSSCNTFVKAVAVVEGSESIGTIHGMTGVADTILVSSIKVRVVVYPSGSAGIVDSDQGRDGVPPGALVIDIDRIIIMAV